MHLKSMSMSNPKRIPFCIPFKHTMKSKAFNFSLSLLVDISPPCKTTDHLVKQLKFRIIKI